MNHVDYLVEFFADSSGY